MIRIYNKIKKSEKGFTLIEIIVVIIIMGIFAAVAVPKFFSIQEKANKAALNGALSEATTRFNHAFAKYILIEKKAPNDINIALVQADYLGANANDCTVGATGGEDIGDFRVCWIKIAPDGLKITVLFADTIGATALAAMPATDKEKTIIGINWGS